MKKLVFLLIFSFSISCYSQTYCSYSGGGCANGLENPTPYVSDLVDEICYILNIQYIETYSGDVGNACASEFQGRPIITYNSGFMSSLANFNRWAPISVLAHEVGHHVNFDVGAYGSFKHPWTKELRADFVSGYVLYHMGASLNDARSAFYKMFSRIGSESHPDSPRRIDALTQGYIRASNGF